MKPTPAETKEMWQDVGSRVIDLMESIDGDVKSGTKMVEAVFYGLSVAYRLGHVESGSCVTPGCLMCKDEFEGEELDDIETDETKGEC